MCRVLVAGVAAAAAVCALPVLAADNKNKFEAIFTAGNQKRLCSKNADGVLVVNKDELANVILEQVGVPLSLLYRANQSGTPQDFINGRSVKYAVSAEKPFGPAAEDEATKAYVEALSGYQRDFVAFPKGSAAANGYKFQVEGFFPAAIYFRDGSPDIECLVKNGGAGGGGGSGKGSGKEKKAETDAFKNFLVRKTSDDLTTELKKAGYASVSFEQKKAGQRGISSDVYLGYKIADIELPYSGTASLIPYVGYSSSHTNSSEDKEVVEPGVIVKTYVRTSWVNFTLAGTGSATFDVEHDARKMDFNLSTSPVFHFGPETSFFGAPTVFGSPLRPIGPLILTPDLLVKVGGSDIGEAGTNKEYAKASSYISYGVTPKLQFGLFEGLLPRELSFLSGLGGFVSYAIVNNNNDVRDVRYLWAQATYSLPNSENWSITLDRKKGEDPSTLLPQDYWKVGLGYRY